MNFKMQYLGTEQSKYNNKYKCVFNMYRFDEHGQMITSAITTSASIWSTQQEADDAGYRAVSIYEETGFLPNLCEKW